MTHTFLRTVSLNDYSNDKTRDSWKTRNKREEKQKIDKNTLTSSRADSSILIGGFLRLRQMYDIYYIFFVKYLRTKKAEGVSTPDQVTRAS